jgi:hypothetical protein
MKIKAEMVAAKAEPPSPRPTAAEG